MKRLYRGLHIQFEGLHPFADTLISHPTKWYGRCHPLQKHRSALLISITGILAWKLFASIEENLTVMVVLNFSSNKI
ncbi:hypothetical protein GWK47_043307 [Chionoecetes opilio]|uniref:Uncharacterized protein n=1 Tax=Chionoecetes opilio TaxID=41210 RepID=A0A8J4Y8B4_CHIOP|nr:hypothetical protein GWK47_043307 [Chionoecetes opilio]